MSKVFDHNAKQEFRKIMKQAVEELVEEVSSTLIAYQKGGAAAIDPETIEYRIIAKAQAISDTAERAIVNYLRLQAKQHEGQE